MKHKQTQLLLILLFTVIILLRVLFPGIDPPYQLTGDMGLYADEGYKTLDPKNVALFGEELLHESDSYPAWSRISPVSHHLYLLSFTTFGVGYVQARLINIVLSILLLVVFFIILYRTTTRNFALISTALLGINAAFLVYNKIALLETVLTFFLMLSVFFWVLAKNQKLYLFGSVASFILAYFVKPLAIFFAPLLIFMLYTRLTGTWKLQDLIQNKKQLIIGVSITGILSAVAIFFIIYTHTIQRFLALLATRRPESFTQFIELIIQFPHQDFFVPNFIILGLGFAGLCLYVYTWFKKREQEDVFFIFALWTILMAGMLILQPYRPPRYFVPLLPAFVVFVTYAYYYSSTYVKTFKIKKLVTTQNLYIILSFFIFSAISILALYKPAYLYVEIPQLKLVFFIGVLFVSSFSTLLFVYAVYKKKVQQILTIILIIHFILQIMLISIWFAGQHYTLIESSKALAQDVPSDAVILGFNWVPALCLENSLHCFHVSGKANEEEEVFRRLGVTHFISEFRHHESFEHVPFYQHPHFQDSLIELQTYTIGKRELTLYLFNQTYYYSDVSNSTE